MIGRPNQDRGCLADRTGGEHAKVGGNRAFSGLMRGRKEKNVNETRATGVRLRSPRSIAILPVHCKENPLRPGPSGLPL